MVGDVSDSTDWIAEGEWRFREVSTNADSTRGKFKAVISPRGEPFVIWSIAGTRGKSRVNRRDGYLNVVEGKSRFIRYGRIELEQSFIDALYMDLQDLKEDISDQSATSDSGSQDGSSSNKRFEW